MTPTMQDTLLQLFDDVRQNPDTIPTMPVDRWQEGSVEWRLLSGFNDMLEQVQQRLFQLMHTEQLLREREEQYRSIFEATNDAVFIMDIEDGHIIEVNPAACNMYGYSYEEFIGLPSSAVIHPNQLPTFREKGIPLIKAGGKRHIQGVNLRKDGSEFPIDLHQSAFIYQGKSHILSVVRDITEQVQAQEQLREKEEQYRAIFEATDDGLNIADLDGFFIEANPAFCRMLGYSHEELIGMNYSQTTFPEYYPVLEESAHAIESGDKYQTQGLARRKDGSPLSVEAHATPFIYKGKPHMLGVMHDITERVEAEQQLREKEEQYRSIFEASSDGLIIADLNGIIVEANPAACNIYGFTYEELLGLSPDALTHPDALDQVRGDIQAIKEGSQLQTRPIGLRKDGSSFYAEVHGTPFTYKGQPHALAIVRDITKQVQAEEQLREKEEQYRNIFEATSDGLIIRNLDGFAVEANPAVCKMHGYSYEEFIGLPRSTIVHPQSHAAVAAYIKAIQEGQTFLGQAIEVRKDGSTFPAEVRGSTFMYLGQPHMLTVLRDITERVEAEKQLREKEEQYRSIFEATYDALFIMDLDGFLVEVNPAFCSMFGYPYEEIIGLQASDLTAQVSLPNLAEALQVLKSGRGTQTEMGQGLHKNGTTFYCESQSTTFTYRGKPHALGVVRDITERVEAEQQLREREEQYRSVFEATSDGLIIRDIDGYVVEANPAACSMHGYTYEEFIGLHRTDIIDPADHAMVAEYMKAIQAGRSFMRQAVDLRKDGSAFPVEVRGSTFTYLGKPHTLSVLRDITERVQAEQQLREKEEQYRSIFEASSDGLFIIDLEDSHTVEVNPMACQMWGYTYEEFLGRRIGISDDTQQIPVHALEVVRSGGQFKMRDITTRKDGTSFHVEVHATPFTYKGKPHLLAIVRDITEQVQAEEQLREKEEQYRSIFEASADGLIIRNMEGTVVQVNPAACKMHGYGYEEYLALSRDTLIHPDYHPQLREIIQTVKAGRTFQGLAVDLRKDGSTFPVEVRSDPFTFLGQPHMLTVLHDITERAEAERQLREREEQYRSIFEATNDALGILDLEDGHIVEVNPALCDIYGYSYDELIGLPSSVVIHPEKLPGFTEIGLPFIRAGGERHVQGVNLRKDGSVFPIDLRQTVFTYQGKPHMLCVIRDITEQVQAQQLLEQRVEERTRELSSLLEISHTVASTLQLDPLLGLILDQLKTVVDYTGSAILVVEGKELIILDNRSPIQEVQLMQLRFPLKNLGQIWETMISRESIIMPDVRDDTSVAQAFRAALGELGETTFSYVRACMVVPLSLKEQVIGMLVLTSSKEEAFIPHHASLALAIANQAAVAIENARLYEQAQELAAIEERQRLARELHDSVSQALYGISLGVHTARMQLDRDPRDLAESLDYVLELAEAALIEMRALIFELRPESLETEGLVTALTKQAAALHARQGIHVQLNLGHEPEMPLKVKQELYRIAQEALHNTVKHARASQVELRLDQTHESVILEVRDNGRGFDTTASFPGHLGLHSMHERVTKLGGTFQIESIEEQGTVICIRIPARGAIQG